jgi:hypothetical protein
MDRRRVVARLLEVAVGLAAAALVLIRFVAIDATSHSASDTLRPWVIQAALIIVVAAGLIALIERMAARPRPG